MSELHEVAAAIAAQHGYRSTMDEARELARSQMPDESPQVIDGVASALVCTLPNFGNGDRVRVIPRGPGDRSSSGRTGTFIEYAKAGYGQFARVHLDGDQPTMRVLVHPESLERA